MSIVEKAFNWAKTYTFSKDELFYSTLLALKILTKNCKMDEEGFMMFMAVYDGIAQGESSTLLDDEIKTLIASARTQNPIVPKSESIEALDKQRKIMMQTMRKENMKAYKAKVRSLLV